MYPFPYFRAFTDYTPVIPEIYWNVYSQEERIKKLCMEYAKLIAFTDSMVDTVNEQYEIIEDMKEHFPELVNEDVVAEIKKRIDDGTLTPLLQGAIDIWMDERSAQVDANTAAIAAETQRATTAEDTEKARAEAVEGALEASVQNIETEYVKAYETVSEMKSDPLIHETMVVKTNGFNEPNDGGAAFYVISNTGTANEMDVIQVQNGLFAILTSVNDSITPEMFGAVGNGTHDDYANIQRCLDFAAEKNVACNLVSTYAVTQTLNAGCDIKTNVNSRIKAISPMNICLVLGIGQYAQGNNRQMKTWHVNVDANSQANTAVQLYQPEHCNIELRVSNFINIGVDCGGTSSGNDENSIVIYYAGLQSGVSDTGVYLHGSDNNINAIYGSNARHAVKLSDGSLYSIGAIHAWVDHSLKTMIENSSIFYLEPESASYVSFACPNLHVNTVYQDTVRYLVDTPSGKNPTDFKLLVDCWQMLMVGESVRIQAFSPSIMARSNNMLNAVITNAMKTAETLMPIFPSIGGASIFNILELLTQMQNKGKEWVYSDYESLPVGCISAVNDPQTSTKYLVETVTDGAIFIKQTRYAATTGIAQTRYRTTYTSWSSWA